MSLPLIAIVGSPSVGKSTIFNRIIGERKSIIEETRGITRDRIYGHTSWLTKPFNVVDTGGIEVENRPFQSQIRMQAELAIDEADIVIFIVDGQIGITDDDLLVSKMLHKANKPTILGVNKIDDISQINNIYEFYSLNLGDPIAISGEHGIGIGDLLDEVIKLLPKEEKEEVVEEDSIKFTLIGRPNVGKSTLFNKIVGSERAIVSNIEGTTRDSINLDFSYNNQKYSIIDTAGLKKRGKIYEAVDKYAALRALRSIDNSDIAILVIDAKEGILEQDKHVVGYAIEAKKAIIVLINKCDLIDDLNQFKKEFKEKFVTEFKFLDYVPLIFASALSLNNKNELFKVINEVYDSFVFQIKTSTLNEIIQEAQMMNETPNFNGGRCRIYYAQQVSSKPLSIVLFVNEPKWMHFSYLRYIENKIRESFELIGSPINLILRKRR